jgi:voltage-gated potassium channel
MAGQARASAKRTEMQDESRLERRIDRAVDRATTPRGAAVIIAGTSTVITLAAGFLMTLVDSEDFPSLGLGMWWAVQTVTTVGYGDHVPTTVAGQLLAALVMLFGIGFLTVITAAITSTFVARSRREVVAEPAMEQFRQINTRLDRIEAALRDSS